jgi:hypothetical protein
MLIMSPWNIRTVGLLTLVGAVAISTTASTASAAGQADYGVSRGIASATAAVSTGLVIKLERRPARGEIVLLSVENPSAYAWCLDAAAFAPSQFLIGIGNRLIRSRAAKVAPADLLCLTFRSAKGANRR